MRTILATFAGVLAFSASVLADVGEECDVPAHFLSSDSKLTRVAAAVKGNRKLVVAVFGTGSSTLPGADGPRSAYPARLEATLKRRLRGVEVRVISNVKVKQTAEDMAKTFNKVLSDEKPALVVWQTGTVEIMRGVDPESFRQTLDRGVQQIQGAGADVILVDMQYSPRTEAMISINPYDDSMRLVALDRDVPLFNRLAIMRYWNDVGVFDLSAATKDIQMAQRVHDCVGRALAAQVIETAGLSEFEGKTTQ